MRSPGPHRWMLYGFGIGFAVPGVPALAWLIWLLSFKGPHEPLVELALSAGQVLGLAGLALAVASGLLGMFIGRMAST